MVRVPLRLVAVALGALVPLACGSADGADGSTATSAPTATEIVAATAGADAIELSIEVSSGGVVVLAAEGVLDVAASRGHRIDSAGLDGGGLEPLAEVWLDDGRLYEVPAGEGGPAEPVDGGLGRFLGIPDPAGAATLSAVLASWLDAPSATTEAVGTETIGGRPATQVRLERSTGTTLDVWVDADRRILRSREVADDATASTTTIELAYPDRVAVPPRP